MCAVCPPPLPSLLLQEVTLSSCLVTVSIVIKTFVRMQTLSSPRSMFCAQLIGAGLAVVISPAAFWLYWSG